MRWIRSHRGDTLVEVVLAIAILGSVLTIAYRMSNESFQLGVDSREHIQAINVAQQQAESLRWFANQQMTRGTSLMVTPAATSLMSTGSGTLLSLCPITTANFCSMQTSGSGTIPQAGTAFDCSASVAPGCTARITDRVDIAPDTHSSPLITYPEIDKNITVTWPSGVQSVQTCNGGGSGCETVSVDVRLADTTNYAPIDCSVAGTPGCSAGSLGLGIGGAPLCPPGYVGSPPVCTLQYSLTPAAVPPQVPGATITVNIANAGGVSLAGKPIYVVLNGSFQPAVTPAGSTYTVDETYPGGNWTVQACPTGAITPQCSNVLTVAQIVWTANTPFYKYFNGTWWFYSTANPALEPGATDPSYIGQGIEGYLAPIGSNRIVQQGLIPLYRYWNTSDGQHFYTTANNALGAPWLEEGSPGYFGPIGPGSSCPIAGTTQLYQWFSPGPNVGEGIGHYYSTTKTSPLPAYNFKTGGGWQYGGAIGCVFTSA